MSDGLVSLFLVSVIVAALCLLLSCFFTNHKGIWMLRASCVVLAGVAIGIGGISLNLPSAMTANLLVPDRHAAHL